MPFTVIRTIVTTSVKVKCHVRKILFARRGKSNTKSNNDNNNMEGTRPIVMNMEGTRPLTGPALPNLINAVKMLKSKTALILTLILTY